MQCFFVATLGVGDTQKKTWILKAENNKWKSIVVNKTSGEET